ncbi:hypothetical protein ACFRMQ_14395 [Kitasatospora sp. NPDC056783]|uniref:hypothetical protein n=1 Tax=Kitasatospora sp. NPDC056783 TaxID=3345943 RepID=UPI00368964FE
MPAAGIARMLVLELLPHGWDVARATGGRIEVDEELALPAGEIAAENAELYRQYAGFAEPVALPEDASAWERAPASSGRDPRWRG